MPCTDSNLSARAMERSACSALNPRERRNPVRYAVDGYGVLSCVIGGMIDRMRTSVMSESISRWRAGRLLSGCDSAARLDHLPPVPRWVAETGVDVAIAAHGLLRELDACGMHALVGGAAVVHAQHER